jgi:hypothetical protein
MDQFNGRILTDAEASVLYGGSSSCSSVIVVQSNGFCQVEQSGGCAPELAAAAVMKAHQQILEALKQKQGALCELGSLLHGLC